MGLASQLQEAFVTTQEGWYLAPAARQQPGIVFSDIIEDQYWNFVTYGALSRLGIDGAFAALEQLGREPSVYIGDDELDVVAALESRGLGLLDTEAVTCWTGVMPEVQNLLRIEEVGDDEQRAADLVKVFADASSGGSTDEPYGALDVEPYVHCLRRALERPETWHYVGYLDDQPVAAGSMSMSNRWLGLYNLAVLPNHRRRGFGNEMLVSRLRKATELGAEKVFLQTVAGSSVEKRYARTGFVTANYGRIYGRS